MVLKKVKEASQAEKKSLLEKLAKLQEESGELAECALSLLKSSGTAYKKKNREDLQEEAVDVILVALDIFFSEGGNIEDLLKTLSLKTEKWTKHQLK